MQSKREVFLERSSSAGKERVRVINVSKGKRTLVEAGFNAGLVIESVGRYLKSTDLVYRRGLGKYHALLTFVPDAEVGREDLFFNAPGAEEEVVAIARHLRPLGAEQLQVHRQVVSLGGKRIQRHGR